MAYLIKFPIAEDGFDNDIIEAIEEVLHRRGIDGAAEEDAINKAKAVLHRYNQPMQIEFDFPIAIRLTSEEHRKIRDAFVKSMMSYRGEYNKIVRSLLLDVLSLEISALD